MPEAQSYDAAADNLGAQGYGRDPSLDTFSPEGTPRLAFRHPQTTAVAYVELADTANVTVLMPGDDE